MIAACSGHIEEVFKLMDCSAGTIAVGFTTDAGAGRNVQANDEEAGFEVVSIQGTEAPSPPALCAIGVNDSITVCARLLADH